MASAKKASGDKKKLARVKSLSPGTEPRPAKRKRVGQKERSRSEVLKVLKSCPTNPTTAKRQRRGDAADAVWVAVATLTNIVKADDDTRVAVARLTRSVVLGLQGMPADLLWLSRLYEQRRRRAWINEVRRAVELSRNRLLPVEVHRQQPEDLAHTLGWLDSRAARLTGEHVARVLTGRATTIEGIAARLAVDSGALDYKANEYAKAKDAFRKLAKEIDT